MTEVVSIINNLEIITVNIRQYLDTDENELISILKEPGGHYFYEKNLDLSGFDEAYVYVLEDKIVGFLVLEIHARTSQIICYVSPSYRRQGIGSTLLEYGKEKLRNLDPNTIWLFFRSDIGNSAQFYQKRGGLPWYSYHLMIYEKENRVLSKGLEKTTNFDEVIPYHHDYFDEYLETRACAFFELNTLIDSRPYDERERREDIYKWADKQKDNIWLFMKGGKIVGSIAIYDGFFDEIFVNTEYQHLGCGSEIVKWALSYCNTKDWEPMLCVVTGNQHAINLYGKNGFRIVQTLEMNRLFSMNKEPDFSGPIGG